MYRKREWHQLAISSSECREIRDLLVREGGLRPLGNGIYEFKDAHSLFWPKFQSQEVQKFIHEVLDLAKAATQSQTKFQRFAGNATIAFSQSQIEEAWRIMNECLLKLIKLSDSTADNDVVCQATIHFFQLTKPSLVRTK